MSQTIQEKNKALVLEAFDTLFNKRDYEAAERYWSPNYIQHSAHIEPGARWTVQFDPQRTPHPALRTSAHRYGGRLCDRPRPIFGHGRPRNWIAADILRIADGVLAEHWDVLQDEATREESQSGLPMFGTTFPV